VFRKPLNVLFLCTGNSARSIMAEALLQRYGQGKFEAHSAGSIPKGQVNPFAIKLLKAKNFNTDTFRSKSWNEFDKEGAPKLDFIFTICDRAANEVCPIWPGQPMSAHWGIEDPDKPELSDDEQYKLFQKAYSELEHRIKNFIRLPFDNLDSLSLQKELDEIGKSTKSFINNL
jgi:arsenate reductase (thioredoxin)